jgi:hypothetical protein
MLAWLYDFFMSFVTFLLGYFGFDLKKKSVSFADDTKDEEKPSEEAAPVAETAAVETEQPVTESA